MNEEEKVKGKEGVASGASMRRSTRPVSPIMPAPKIVKKDDIQKVLANTLKDLDESKNQAQIDFLQQKIKVIERMLDLYSRIEEPQKKKFDDVW